MRATVETNSRSYLICRCRQPLFRFPYTFALMLLLACLHFASLANAQQRPATDRLFPDTSKMYVAVPNPADFQDRWHKIELGRMLDDPIMQTFREDLRAQIDSEL